MNAEYLLKTYRETGIIHPMPGLSDDEIQQAQDNYRGICDPGQITLQGEQRIFGHLVYPWVAQLVVHPAVLKVVRSLIGPDVLVWVSEFNVKAPQTQGFFSWHQDLYYWRHRYADLPTIPIVTVWLAITDANQENGAMRVLPGSQSALVHHVEKPRQHNMLTRAIPVVASPGQPTFLVLLAVIFVYTTMIGFVAPNSAAMALAKHAEHAGSASALLGTLLFGIGAISSVVASHILPDAPTRALILVMGSCSALATLVFYRAPPNRSPSSKL
jgi:Phytanoyl-CoA dioxygenase (PhyH)